MKRIEHSITMWSVALTLKGFAMYLLLFLGVSYFYMPLTSCIFLPLILRPKVDQDALIEHGYHSNHQPLEADQVLQPEVDQDTLIEGLIERGYHPDDKYLNAAWDDTLSLILLPTKECINAVQKTQEEDLIGQPIGHGDAPQGLVENRNDTLHFTLPSIDRCMNIAQKIWYGHTPIRYYDLDPDSDSIYGKYEEVVVVENPKDDSFVEQERRPFEGEKLPAGSCVFI